MRYMGSKRRLARYILPIMLKDRKEGQWWVEPFMGGCNILKLIDGPRMGSDFHTELVAFLTAVQSGWQPPAYINEDDYKRIKTSSDLVLKGYVGFLFSFGATYFGSFRRQGTVQHIGEEIAGTPLKNNYKSMDYTNKVARNTVKALYEGLIGARLCHSSYENLKIPAQSIIYCDPPYAGTTGYGVGFNHNIFYDWCRLQKAKGHTIFISEYGMPKDFKCIWSMQLTQNLKQKGSARTVEKLFTL